MEVICLLVAVLLMVSAIVTFRIAKSSIGDRKIRRAWQALSVVMGGVALAGIVFSVSGRVANVTVLELLLPLFLILVLVVNCYLLNRTVTYFNEVNTGEGINVYDPVSGVFNRIYLEQRLDSEVARCHRYGSPLAVVAVEIKDYLQLNDEYGHQGSAIATSKLARRLKDLLRETDVVASFSAGRFVLVLPDTPEGSLTGLINRLRSAVDSMVVIDGAGLENSVKINVMFGTSHCELKTRDGQELIRKAFSVCSQESPFDFMEKDVDAGRYKEILQ